MTHSIQAQELLYQVLDTLEIIALRIETQAEEVDKCIASDRLDLDMDKLLVSQKKATITSIELLRNEIEELHHVVNIIFKEDY